MAEGKAWGKPTGLWKVGFSAGGVLTASPLSSRTPELLLFTTPLEPLSVYPAHALGSQVHPGAQRASLQDCRGEALPLWVSRQSPILHACMEPLNSTRSLANTEKLAGIRPHPLVRAAPQAAHRSYRPRSRRKRIALHISAQSQRLALQAIGPASSTIRHRGNCSPSAEAVQHVLLGWMCSHAYNGTQRFPSMPGVYGQC